MRPRPPLATPQTDRAPVIAGRQGIVANDPAYASERQGYLAQINAPLGWAHAQSARVPVAVIDTGIAYDHVALRGHVWTHVRPGGSDPRHALPDPDLDLLPLMRDPRDENGHGTEVAGVIGATANDGRLRTRVAACVVLIPIRVQTADEPPSPAAFAAAIDYAVAAGARVINCSWTARSTGAPSVRAAIDRAEQAGVFLVAAAGNRRRDIDAPRTAPTYPVAHPNPNVVGVMGVNDRDAWSAPSNWGATSVDLAAPMSVDTTGLADTFGPASGTSFATAQVTAALALALGQEPADASPAETIARVRRRLLTGVQQLPSLAGKCTSGGRLDLAFLARP